jgi:hypothetical protein
MVAQAQNLVLGEFQWILVVRAARGSRGVRLLRLRKAPARVP